MASPTVLITGASSGIGLDLAELFAKDGSDLWLVARSADRLMEEAGRLSQQYGIQARTIAQDLSRPGSAKALMSQLDRNSRIDILVNNAGFGMRGSFTEIPAETHQEMMQLNMVTPTELIQLILPGMIERKSGRILNVASTAAFQPGPYMAVYYATKAYLLSFSEALGNELQGTGITITTLCPGPTVTEFQRRAGLEGMGVFRTPAVMASLPVARQGYRALMRGKRVEIPGWLNKAMVFSTRLAPRRMTTQIVRKLQEKRRD